MDIENLKKWFLKEKRDFPWRGSPSPYEVWISEVMLQQTQATVVVDYFLKWMQVFPTIQALAAASLEQVIKIWEGLGYYSRARNLHKAAQYLVSYHEGRLPEDATSLALIPGIGPYTAGAIQSFAFHKKAAAIDGNVLRVLSRYLCLEEDITTLATQKKIRAGVEALLPDEEPWVVMEALIELGAKICKKHPLCFGCPIKQGCKGKEKAKELPFKAKKTSITKLTRHVALILYQREVLVRKENSGKVMADLYEFPYWNEKMAIKELGMDVSFVKDLEHQTHSFTRFRVQLLPTLWVAREKKSIRGYEWIFS